MPVVLQIVDIDRVLCNARNLIASHKNVAIYRIEVMLIIIDQRRDELFRIRLDR